MKLIYFKSFDHVIGRKGDETPSIERFIVVLCVLAWPKPHSVSVRKLRDQTA